MGSTTLELYDELLLGCVLQANETPYKRLSYSRAISNTSPIPILDAPIPTRYNLPAVVKTVAPAQAGATEFIKEKDQCLHIQNASIRKAAETCAAPTMPCNPATSPPARIAVPCACRTRSARIAGFTKGVKLSKSRKKRKSPSKPPAGRDHHDPFVF